MLKLTVLALHLNNPYYQRRNQLQTAVAMLIRLVVRAPFLAIGCGGSGFAVRSEIIIDFFNRYAFDRAGIIYYYVKDRPSLPVDTKKTGPNFPYFPGKFRRRARDQSFFQTGGGN